MRNWTYRGVHNDSHYVETLKLDRVFKPIKTNYKVCPKQPIITQSTGSRDEVLKAQPSQVPAPSRGCLSLFWRKWEGVERCGEMGAAHGVEATGPDSGLICGKAVERQKIPEMNQAQGYPVPVPFCLWLDPLYIFFFFF